MAEFTILHRITPAANSESRGSDDSDIAATIDELAARCAAAERAVADLREQLRLETSKREQADAAREMTERQFGVIRVQERRRLSQELHDSVGQYLVTIGAGLKTIERTNHGAETRRRVQRLRELTRDLDTEIEHLCREMRPPVLTTLGLYTALYRLVDSWAAATSIPVRSEIECFRQESFMSVTQLAVYRTAQEALTNISNHAGATQVGIVALRSDTTLKVVIEDNGTGFSPNAALFANKNAGMGITGMRERAEQLGGVLHIDSRPGWGTVIELRLPIGKSDRVDSPFPRI